MLRPTTHERNGHCASASRASRCALQVGHDRARAPRRRFLRCPTTFPTIRAPPGSDMVSHDESRRETIGEQESAPRSSWRRAAPALVVSRGVGVVRAARGSAHARPRCRRGRSGARSAAPPVVRTTLRAPARGAHPRSAARPGLSSLRRRSAGAPRASRRSSSGRDARPGRRRSGARHPAASG